jgi:hypothetical protein
MTRPHTQKLISAEQQNIFAAYTGYNKTVLFNVPRKNISKAREEMS